MRFLITAAAWAALSATPIFAASADQAAADTDARLQALEQELAALKAANASKPAGDNKTTGDNKPTDSKPTSGVGNQFNPAISLILQGTYADYSMDPEDYSLTGFYVGEEAGLRPQGFSLGESELTLSASIDDQWYGQMTLALENEDGETVTAVEEAYVETTALPDGFTLKMGRFLSGIGYLNHHHSHTDAFINRPLVYQTFIQHHLSDDGLQLRYLLPTDLFVEIGLETLRGNSYPFEGAGNEGNAVQTAFVHVGGDAGSESSWLAGLSQLRGETAAGSDGFVGDSDLTVADFTWKWSPHGNPKLGGLVLRTEWFSENRDGDLTDETGAVIEGWDSTRDGYYLEALYRFAGGWQSGVRLDTVSGDAAAPGDYASGASSNSRSVVLGYQHSEFSLLRVQFSQFDTANGGSENGIWLQYLMALGAHGAHKF